ncbi:MAG TPA: argininosuccinate lyase [Terriglobia bacterium]|nr:argininosuccinate lyase [Terriglobia bacterium]
MKLWGGRFAHHQRDVLFEKYSESFSLDQRWILYDLRVNQAYVRILGRARVLGAGEVRSLIRGLEKIRRHVESHPQWARRETSEDVHTWVEARLIREVGPAARKLRTGRSRNDLVATEARLYVKDAITELQHAALDLLRALYDLARRHIHAVMPGFTHLQPAQPILFSHYALAYFEMFLRDWDRLEDCRKRADELPMGAGALAGTSFPIDRQRLARELGFARAARNSVDVTSDRDFVCELLFVCSLTLAHSSRLAEDLVIYSSPGFGYVELADAYSTGSSIMPQKRNPDAMELVRGKAARGIGRLTGMLALLKGLPLAYNRDLQEDKAALFDGVDTTRDTLQLVTQVLATLRIHSEQMKSGTSRGFLTATDIADELVGRGIPFAQAHEQVGKLVRHCVDHQKTFEELSTEQARACVPSWDSRLNQVAISPKNAVKRKNVTGGTAPNQVGKQIRQARTTMVRLNRLLARRK